MDFVQRYPRAMIWLLLGCAPKLDRITATDLHAGLIAHPEQYVVVDVRTGLEFNAGHIEGATHIGYPSTLWRADEIRASSNQTVVLICLSGHRSRLPLGAVRKHLPASKVIDLEGGMQAWRAQNLPESH